MESDLEADVVLSDGGTVHVRPIRPEDGPRILRFHERQSPESIYFRYFSPRPRLNSSDVDRLTRVDGVDRMAFVGIINDELVGVARYDRHPARSVAEVAFFTDDAHAGRGLATVLLEYLAAAAREVGLTGFTAQVLPTNRRMLGVFKQVGFEVSSRFSDGVIEVEFPIEPTEEALARMAERARLAEARSVARILAPRSIAVIGASRRPDSLGQAVFRRLLEGDFDGVVYPVNAEAEVVASVRAHPSILDVPDEIDLAVVVVPADQVAEVVEQCGRKRVQGLVVISAGFAETGPEGAERQSALVEQARRLGLRLVGPNTMGVVNTAPDVRMLATFASVAPRPGRVAVSSQSGTVGAALLRRLEELGVGVSSFVATGNKADVSGNDLLQYWEDDLATDVVLLYLESFGNPRNFARIARRVGQVKPIVAVKTGPTGGRVGDAVLSQTGVIRVDTLEQLFDVTRVLVDQPLPVGGRVAVLSTHWGPAVLGVDACLAAGLELAQPDESVVAAVGPVMVGGAGSGAAVRLNPLELVEAAGPHEVGAAVRALLADPGVDALLVLHAPSLQGDVGDVAAAIGEAAADGDKPVVASFLGATLPADRPAGAVPVFPFPESAALALGRVVRYRAWRDRQTGVVPVVDGIELTQAHEMVLGWLAGAEGGSHHASVDEVLALLRHVGVEPVAQRVVAGVEGAVEAAEAIGWPVALKALGVERPSRTEEGGVAVDLFGEDDLRSSYGRMRAFHGSAMDLALVQEMAPQGVDVRIDVLQHPVLGSVLELGAALGGPCAQNILPLTDDDAVALVEDGPLGPELRALAAPGRAALVDLLLRLSALADAVPEVAELHLGPVIVSDGRAAITGMRLVATPWPTESPLRRLG